MASVEKCNTGVMSPGSASSITVSLGSSSDKTSTCARPTLSAAFASRTDRFSGLGGIHAKAKDQARQQDRSPSAFTANLGFSKYGCSQDGPETAGKLEHMNASNSQQKRTQASAPMQTQVIRNKLKNWLQNVSQQTRMSKENYHQMLQDQEAEDEQVREKAKLFWRKVQQKKAQYSSATSRMRADTASVRSSS